MSRSLPLLIDVNLDYRILRGLRLRIPSLDFISAVALGLREASDEDLLAWAAQHSRVLVTQDVRTMPDHAYRRLARGERMAGVVIVPDRLPIGKAIEELEIITQCLQPEEIEGRVISLPAL